MYHRCITDDSGESTMSHRWFSKRLLHSQLFGPIRNLNFRFRIELQSLNLTMSRENCIFTKYYLAVRGAGNEGVTHCEVHAEHPLDSGWSTASHRWQITTATHRIRRTQRTISSNPSNEPYELNWIRAYNSPACSNHPVDVNRRKLFTHWTLYWSSLHTSNGRHAAAGSQPVRQTFYF